MFNIKECKKYLEVLDTIELTNEDKHILKQLGNEHINKLLLKIKGNITNKMLTDNLSPEFVKGAIYTLLFIRANIYRKK